MTATERPGAPQGTDNGHTTLGIAQEEPGLERLPAARRSAGGVPQRGSVHPGDPGFACEVAGPARRLKPGRTDPDRTRRVPDQARVTAAGSVVEEAALRCGEGRSRKESEERREPDQRPSFLRNSATSRPLMRDPSVSRVRHPVRRRMRFEGRGLSISRSRSNSILESCDPSRR